MHANPINFSHHRSQGAVSCIVPDRRRHERVELFGRCMRASKEEEHHRTRLDRSAGGRAALSPVQVADGERGFAIKINATRHRRAKLAAQLTGRAKRSKLAAEGRQYTRVTGNSRECALQLDEGVWLTCWVRPEIGTSVVPSGLRARVLRQRLQGYGEQFLDTENPAALRRHFFSRRRALAVELCRKTWVGLEKNDRNSRN